jgi:hypothetical protein
MFVLRKENLQPVFAEAYSFQSCVFVFFESCFPSTYRTCVRILRCLLHTTIFHDELILKNLRPCGPEILDVFTSVLFLAL